MNAQIAPADVERAKAKIPISEIIGRYVTWDRKKTRARAGDFWACCPFHGEKSPSFHCEDKKGRYFCFGCSASGDHITFLMEYCGRSFVEAIRELGGDVSSIDPEERKRWEEKAQADRARREAEQQQSDEDRTAIARAKFKAMKPIAGTAAEQYLLGRGIPAQEFDPARFRFGVWDRADGRTCLTCAVTDVADAIKAVWRIYVTPDGEAVTGADGKKLKLGFGPAGGGAVRIGGVAPRISVCEGVETGFAVRAIQQNKQPVWPGLSAPGMTAIVFPPEVRHVDIFVDGDLARFDPNGKLLPAPGQEAGAALARRLQQEGRTYSMNEPPPPDDWLDVWRSILSLAQEVSI